MEKEGVEPSSAACKAAALPVELPPRVDADGWSRTTTARGNGFTDRGAHRVLSVRRFGTVHCALIGVVQPLVMSSVCPGKQRKVGFEMRMLISVGTAALLLSAFAVATAAAGAPTPSGMVKLSVAQGAPHLRSEDRVGEARADRDLLHEQLDGATQRQPRAQRRVRVRLDADHPERQHGQLPDAREGHLSRVLVRREGRGQGNGRNPGRQVAARRAQRAGVQSRAADRIRTGTARLTTSDAAVTSRPPRNEMLLSI